MIVILISYDNKLFPFVFRRLLVEEKARGLCSAVLVMTVTFGGSWFAACWFLTLVPVVFVYASTLEGPSNSTSFVTIHKVVR